MFANTSINVSFKCFNCSCSELGEKLSNFLSFSSGLQMSVPSLAGPERKLVMVWMFLLSCELPSFLYWERSNTFDFLVFTHALVAKGGLSVISRSSAIESWCNFHEEQQQYGDVPTSNRTVLLICFLSCPVFLTDLGERNAEPEAGRQNWRPGKD